MLNEIVSLLKKDFRLEWRQRFSLGGVLIQIFTSVFIVYIAVPESGLKTRNSLFWIVMVFSAINGVAKSYMSEQPDKHNYFRQLIRPDIFITSKLIYNFILMSTLSIITWLVFSLFINLENSGLDYLITIILTGIGLSSVFTMSSVLVTRLENSFIVLPVISLPLVIPFILLGIKSCSNALKAHTTSEMLKDWSLIFLLGLLVSVLAVVLYRFILRD